MTKKILLLSDTHSYIDERILYYVNSVDEVWHAGDIGNIEVIDKIVSLKPARAVYGNIDNHTLRSTYKENEFFLCEKVSVLMTHIAGSPSKYNSRVTDLLEKYKPQLFICGHSHILKVMQDKKYNCLFMNPGAAGIHGFHKMRTMIRFAITQGKIHALEVIELGKRGAISSGQ